MGISIKQKTLDILFKEDEDGKYAGNVSGEDRKYRKEDMALRLHFSLMGENSPVLSDLSTDYSIDGKSVFFRYDWIVGATPIKPCYDWDWFNKIVKDRAIVIQLLIDTGESGCGVTECNPLLLGMQPSKDTASWVDRNSEKLGENLAQLSKITESFSKIATGILKTSAIMSSFINSEGDGQKNWFIYRFLDEKRKCYAVEWNINRTVLHQYGSVLRGSLLLAFHAGSKPAKPVTLLLRPRLHFGDEKRMDYLPPVEELEGTNPVAIEINPVHQ